MWMKKTILITLFLCMAGSITSYADVIVYENDFEDPCQVDALSGWNWGDGGIVHNVVYTDYEGNTAVEHTGIIDASAAAVTTRFGTKWGITLSGNTSVDPNDYTIEFDLRSVSGDWDPIDLEFFVLTGGGNGVGYGSGASSYAQADGWVHVTANLAELPVGWWAGQAWDMTDPNWQIEVGGPPWPGVEVPAGTPAWDQIWLMDNLKITMVSAPSAVTVHEDDFEDRVIGSDTEGWLWFDNAVSHVGQYVDFEGSIVREESGTLAADINQRFGYKVDIEMTGNTSEDPNDYIFELDIRNLEGNWDPHLIEIFVLTYNPEVGGGSYGYGLPVLELYQADEWVHIEYNLGDLAANNKTWWQGTGWDMTNPLWSYEIGGPPWPGVEIEEAWTQILLVDNLKITMLWVPEVAKRPVPADMSIEIPRDVVLSWMAGDFADKHNVYFGTDFDNVNQASPDNPLDVIIEQGITETSYDPPGILESNKTYYWRVDEVNDSDPNSPWTGEVWSFTTGDYIVIDDFEAYNDLNEAEEGSNRIYLTWSDGYANPNVNGSTIGYPDPDFANGEHFVETDIVHGGNQSGPFLYNNTTASYSEVTLPISTLGGDWSQSDFNVLSLWFYGDQNNTGSEQLYVKLNNSRLEISGVDLTLEQWQNVEIPLADFGIGLTNVTQIVIGVERTGATGGQGMLFLDDIRLRYVEQ